MKNRHVPADKFLSHRETNKPAQQDIKIEQKALRDSRQRMIKD
jgi:hypothetical protein